MAVSFRPRRGTLFDWEAKNPRLGEGEWGYEIGTGRYKVGDGVRRWKELPYFVSEDRLRLLIAELTPTFVISTTKPVGYPDNTLWIEPIEL